MVYIFQMHIFLLGYSGNLSVFLSTTQYKYKYFYKIWIIYLQKILKSVIKIFIIYY